MENPEHGASLVRRLFDARSEAEWCAVGAHWLKSAVSKAAPVQLAALRVQRGSSMTFGRSDERLEAPGFPSDERGDVPAGLGFTNPASSTGSPTKLTGEMSVVRGGGGPRLRWVVDLVQGLASADEQRVLHALIANALAVLAASYESRVLVRERLLEAWQTKLGRTSRASLPLLLEGKTETEIARQLHKSPHTIHDCVKDIYRCIGVNSRTALHRMWTEAMIETASAAKKDDD